MDSTAQFTQPDAVSEQPQVDQSLGDGITQAPDPTVDPNTAPNTPSTQAEPQVSYEEFQRIQSELAQERDLLARIQRAAEAQEEQQRQQEYYANLKSKLQNELKRVIDNGDENEITEHIFGVVNGELKQVQQLYQQKINDSYAEMREAFLGATLPGFANQLVRDHGLPAELEQTLMKFKTPEQMEEFAVAFKTSLQLTQQQQQQQAVQQQVQARRDSGVNAIGGVQGGPMPEQEIQPGTAKQLRPVLRNILGL
jgi:predicted house-cleaning noncanonical NTP pyrophosphatase (MazG superfamily)